jgi:uncharacterized membrane protein
MKKIVWCAVLLLAFLGLLSSVGRAVSVFESVILHDGPLPPMSRLDRESVALTSALLGIEPGSSLYRDGQEQNERFLGKFNHNPTATLLHVVPAALFMILAPLQFSSRIRSRHLRWHRWSGRIVMASAVPIGLSGLYFGLRMPFSGAIESAAIALFGALFLTALVCGFRAIRKGDRSLHREWMIRMFGVAIAVSMVRLTGIFLAVVTREGPDAWFAAAVWIGFSLTAGCSELWIHYTRREEAAAHPIAPLLPGASSSA